MFRLSIDNEDYLQGIFSVLSRGGSLHFQKNNRVPVCSPGILNKE